MAATIFSESAALQTDPGVAYRTGVDAVIAAAAVVFANVADLRTRNVIAALPTDNGAVYCADTVIATVSAIFDDIASLQIHSLIAELQTDPGAEDRAATNAAQAATLFYHALGAGKYAAKLAALALAADDPDTYTDTLASMAGFLARAAAKAAAKCLVDTELRIG